MFKKQYNLQWTGLFEKCRNNIEMAIFPLNVTTRTAGKLKLLYRVAEKIRFLENEER